MNDLGHADCKLCDEAQRDALAEAMRFRSHLEGPIEWSVAEQHAWAIGYNQAVARIREAQG